MTKLMLAAGAAALAIMSPALAQKGEKGGGNDRGGGQSAKAERGGGGQARQDMRGGGQARQENRGGGNRELRQASRPDRAERQAGRAAAQADRGNGRGNAQVRAERTDRGNDRVRVAREERVDNRADRAVARQADRIDTRDVRVARIDRDIDRDNDGARFVPQWNQNGLIRGFADGCPPGLAKKNNGCLPPGQARKLVGTSLPAALSNSILQGPYSQWYRDDDDFFYRNDDDYIYRVRREGGLIDALFPQADRDYYYYPVGMNYPSDYNYYNVPYQYRSFYPDGGNYAYRYGDGAIYQVNPSNGLITGIAALLAGDLGVGQTLPASYGAYNLPLSYRDRYYDTADNLYRYNDGYIYQVDPTTQLITAVINAIV